MNSNTTITDTNAQAVALQKGGLDHLEQGVGSILQRKGTKTEGIEVNGTRVDLKASRVELKATAPDLKATGEELMALNRRLTPL